MSLVYFCDRNLGKGFPERLRELGLWAEKHDDHFQQDTPDELWIQQVSLRGWIILTLDDGFRHKPAEKAAVWHSGARVIVLPTPKSRSSGWLLDLAWEFYQAQPKVQAFLAGYHPPFMAKFRASPSKKGRKRYRLDKLPL